MNSRNIKKPREFLEVEGGHYDKFGFYHTPNGSFWDCDGIYFDRTGKDVHGGTYDKDMNYHPGEGWIDSLMCYEDEVDMRQNNVFDDFGGNDYEDGDYDVYEDIQEDLKQGNFKGPSYYDVMSKNQSSDSSKQQNFQKFNKISLKEPENFNPNSQINNNNKPNNNYSQNSVYGNSSMNKAMSNPVKSKEPKEIIEISSITSSKISDALSNKKEIKCEGFQISEGLDVSDDEDDNRGKNRGGYSHQGKRNKKF